MATIPEALAAAQQFHQAGHLREAEHIYRQIVQAEPNHAEAWHSLGAVCLAQGKLDEAAACNQRVQQSPASLSSATSFQADLCNDRGISFAQQGRLDEAVANFRQALQIHPDHAGAHNNLGIVLAQCGQLDEAVKHYEEALRIRPDFFEAYNNLGNALRDLGRIDEAIPKYEEAVYLKPDFAEAYNNHGIALVRHDRLEEAAALFRKTLQLKPNYVKARSNLGNVVRDLGQFDEALECYDEALRLQPDYPDAYRNRALVYLIQGDFEQGWRDYEWRWRCQDVPPRPFRQPVWDGSPLAGRTILLHAEQGMGDTLQFIRYASLVRERGGRVHVECQQPLVRLVATCPGVERVLARGSELPDFAVHAPLLNLPGILGTTLATIPADVPYLSADTNLVEQWRRELNSIRAFKIGIAWQGNPQYPDDCQRSIALRHFAPLGRLEGVRLVSLQKGPGLEQLARVDFPVVDLSDRLDETSGAFMDTVAIMQTLDLVVVSDSAVAHCAGALGVPVWVALPFIPDWRWLLERTDSPWYPSMLLFRQKRRGDWTEVFERIAQAVRALAVQGKTAPSGTDYSESSVRRANASVCNDRGTAFVQQGRLDEAIACFRQALSLQPDDAGLYNNLGIALSQQGKFDEAIAAHQQAVRLQPDFAGAYNNLGNAFRDHQRFEEAMIAYEQALRLAPDSAEALNNQGIAFAQAAISRKRQRSSGMLCNSGRTMPRHTATWATCSRTWP